MARNIKAPEEYLFVDGYNIINSWDIFLKTRDTNLENVRNKLIDIMLEYQVSTGIKVILVFDAHLVKGNNGTKEKIQDMIVVYTKEHETADNYIERCIEEMGRKKRVRVATSDQLEQQIILARGATRISARELEIEVFSKRDRISKNQQNENQKNNYHFGRLDERNIEKLKNIIRIKEDT